MMLFDVCLSDVCLSRTSGLTREQRGPRMTKIGTEVAHVTHDLNTTFKVKRLKVKVTAAGHIVAASRLQLVIDVIDSMFLFRTE